MVIVSYNVNGIRAAINKGLISWLSATNPDVVCLQEIKAELNQIDQNIFHDLGYQYIYWYPAKKKGYSGTAILSKIPPQNYQYGFGNELYDNEGRMILLDFDNFSLMTVYMPSGSSGDERQAFKMAFLDFFQNYIDQLKTIKPNLIINGDFNICHRPIDIHNPISNANSSGFLPEERQWLDNFFKSGFIDTFRHFNPNPHQYTWWSFRANARQKNLGWRIDYQAISTNLLPWLQRAIILPEAKHSDHCPTLIEIAKPR